MYNVYTSLSYIVILSIPLAQFGLLVVHPVGKFCPLLEDAGDPNNSSRLGTSMQEMLVNLRIASWYSWCFCSLKASGNITLVRDLPSSTSPASHTSLRSVTRPMRYILRCFMLLHIVVCFRMFSLRVAPASRAKAFLDEKKYFAQSSLIRPMAVLEETTIAVESTADSQQLPFYSALLCRS